MYAVLFKGEVWLKGVVDNLTGSLPPHPERSRTMIDQPARFISTHCAVLRFMLALEKVPTLCTAAADLKLTGFQKFCTSLPKTSLHAVVYHNEG